MKKRELDKYLTQQKKEKVLSDLKEILKRNGIKDFDLEVVFKDKQVL